MARDVYGLIEDPIPPTNETEEEGAQRIAEEKRLRENLELQYRLKRLFSQNTLPTHTPED